MFRTERPELSPPRGSSVGALGVVTKVTLQCVPLYALHAVDAKMPLEQTLADLDELVETNDHFEFFWFPHTETALTRRFQRLPGDVELKPMSAFTRTVDDRIVTNVGFEAMLRVGTRFPALVPGITRFVTKAVSDRDFTDLRRTSSPRRATSGSGRASTPCLGTQRSRSFASSRSGSRSTASPCRSRSRSVS